MAKKNLDFVLRDRREFFKLSSALGLGAATWAHVPWLANRYVAPTVASLYDAFNRSALAQSVDGFDYLVDAAKGGLSLLRFTETAQAAVEDEEIYYVNINVTCGISPKFFTIFEAENAAGLKGGLLAPGNAANFPNTLQYLKDTGLEKMTTIDRFKPMRMTEWFSQILMHGTNDGKDIGTTASVLDKVKPYIAPFTDEARIQIAHALTGGVSHIYSSFQLTGGGDINYEMQKGGLYSPLQLLCFGYPVLLPGDDDLNSGNNKIQGPGGSVLVPAKTTNNFVQTINQLVADSFLSTDKCAENNIICSFDKLARSRDANELRNTMLEKLDLIRTKIKTMGPNIEGVANATAVRDEAMALHSVTTTRAQTTPPTNFASMDFMSQMVACCELMTNLDAYRNFSCHLNIVDLDGRKYDAKDDPEAIPHGHNYVNGHRQLAIALNMLGTLIKRTGKKIYVTVSADTGRAVSGVDAVGSTAILMAPKSTKLKDAYVYYNDTALTTNDGAAADPSSNPAIWGKDLRDQADAADTTKPTSFKAWAAGVYHFILGKRMANEPYVKIKKDA